MKLVCIMTIHAKKYGDQARAVQERERSIKAKRGNIYDRNGVILAGNRAVCSISVIHNQIEEPETVIRVLSEKLEMQETDVRKKVEKRSVREKIKSNVDRKLAEEIREMNLAGVMIDEDYKRFYPYDTLASHVLGFTGSDNQGIVGIEVFYKSAYGRKWQCKYCDECKRGRSRKSAGAESRRKRRIQSGNFD